MRECLICNAVLEDVPLNEGRCPFCGALVEWKEPSEAESAIDSKVQKKKDEVKTDHIATLWKQSIVTNSDLHRTIKSDSVELTVSDSVYSIQRREILESKDLQFGSSLDYELLEVIGEGGVGVVYAARQASIDRRVAIKMLREEYRVRPEHRDKFLAEAVLTGELDHPNIVPIYDLGRNKEGELFYAMKNVVGTPWDRVIQNQSLEQNLEILHKVADAIAFAHSRGVIHRDLKPENVMLGGFGEVLVMDWGIAMPTEGFNKSSSILRSQAMGGTPAYMAPELAAGPVEKIGRASDIYLLGAILFEILTGTPPHHGDDVLQCVRNAAKNIIVETEKSGELMDIAMKAMETIPGRRYRTVQDFQKAIRNFEYHRESLVLMENAKIELQAAQASSNYSAFNHVVFAFGEALKLWPENAEAREGLSNAKIAYAETALQREDFDLGLSILEGEELNAPILINRLKQGQRDRAARQSRLNAIRRIAVVLGAFILVSGSLGSAVILFLYSRSTQLNDSLSKTQGELKESARLALEQKEIAERNEEDATKAKDRAEDQALIAKKAREAAERARLETVKEKRKADENAYFAEVGLIGASIQQNSFQIASNLLDGLSQSNEKSRLRHWEWARYKFLAQGERTNQLPFGVRTYSLADDINAMDVSRDGKRILYGLADGEVGWIDPVNGDSIAKARVGDKLFALAVSPDGRFLATSAWNAKDGNQVRVWELADGKIQLRSALIAESSRIDTLAFHSDSAIPYLSGGGEKKWIRVWDWNSGASQKTFVGHLERITCVRYSPNGKWIASSSTDGTVRVWEAFDLQKIDVAETQRFSDHPTSVLSIDFSTDSRRIASGDGAGNVYVWKINESGVVRDEVEEIRLSIQGEPPRPLSYLTLRGHKAAVNGLRFSQDGDKLVTCGSDNLVCSWTLPQSEAGVVSSDPLPSSQSDLGSGNQIDRLVLPTQMFRGHGGWVRNCAYAGDWVASSGDDQNLKIWNPAGYREKMLMSGGEVPAIKGRISPDGKWVATSYLDGSIKLWSMEDGKPLGVLREGHDYLSNSAKLIRGGSTLITAAGDNTLRMWNTELGTQVFVLEGSGRNIQFAISNDEKWLVSTGDRSGIPIVSLDTNSVTARLRSEKSFNGTSQEPFEEPSSVAISEDGRTVAATSGDGLIALWDVSSMQVIRSWKAHKDNIVHVFFVGKLGGLVGEEILTVSIDGSIARFDPLTGMEIPQSRIQTYSPIQAAAISKDRQLLACSAPINQEKSRLWVFDIRTGLKVYQRDWSDIVVQSLDLEDDAKRIVRMTCASPEKAAKSIVEVELATGEFQVFPVEGAQSASLWGILNDAQRNRLITFGGRGARLWSTQRDRLIASFRPNIAVSEIQVTPDSSRVISGSRDGKLQLWLVAEQRSIRQYNRIHTSEIVSIEVDREDGRFFVADRSGLVSVWEQDRSEPIQQSQLPDELAATAMTLDVASGLLWISTEQGKVVVLNSSGLQLVDRIEAHREPVTCLSLSQDGQLLATGSNDKSICVWKTNSKEKIATFVGHSAPISSLEFSQDSLRLLSASQDTTVRLWDSSDLSGSSESIGKKELLGEIMALNHHRSEVSNAEFSDDGRFVLTAGLDGDCVAWEAENLSPQIRVAQDQVELPRDGEWYGIGACIELSVPSPGSLSRYGFEIKCKQDYPSTIEFRLARPNTSIVVEENSIHAIGRSGSKGPKIAEITIENTGTTALQLKPLEGSTPSLVRKILESIEIRSLDVGKSVQLLLPVSVQVKDLQTGEICSDASITLELPGDDPLSRNASESQGSSAK